MLAPSTVSHCVLDIAKHMLLEPLSYSMSFLCSLVSDLPLAYFSVDTMNALSDTVQAALTKKSHENVLVSSIAASLSAHMLTHCGAIGTDTDATVSPMKKHQSWIVPALSMVSFNLSKPVMDPSWLKCVSECLFNCLVFLQPEEREVVVMKLPHVLLSLPSCKILHPSIQDRVLKTSAPVTLNAECRRLLLEQSKKDIIESDLFTLQPSKKLVGSYGYCKKNQYYPEPSYVNPSFISEMGIAITTEGMSASHIFAMVANTLSCLKEAHVSPSDDIEHASECIFFVSLRSSMLDLLSLMLPEDRPIAAAWAVSHGQMTRETLPGLLSTFIPKSRSMYPDIYAFSSNLITTAFNRLTISSLQSGPDPDITLAFILHPLRACLYAFSVAERHHGQGSLIIALIRCLAPLMRLPVVLASKLSVSLFHLTVAMALSRLRKASVEHINNVVAFIGHLCSDKEGVPILSADVIVAYHVVPNITASGENGKVYSNLYLALGLLRVTEDMREQTSTSRGELDLLTALCDRADTLRRFVIDSVHINIEVDIGRMLTLLAACHEMACSIIRRLVTIFSSGLNTYEWMATKIVHLREKAALWLWPTQVIVLPLFNSIVCSNVVSLKALILPPDVPQFLLIATYGVDGVPLPAVLKETSKPEIDTYSCNYYDGLSALLHLTYHVERVNSCTTSFDQLGLDSYVPWSVHDILPSLVHCLPLSTLPEWVECFELLQRWINCNVLVIDDDISASGGGEDVSPLWLSNLIADIRVIRDDSIWKTISDELSFTHKSDVVIPRILGGLISHWIVENTLCISAWSHVVAMVVATAQRVSDRALDTFSVQLQLLSRLCDMLRLLYTNEVRADDIVASSLFILARSLVDRCRSLCKDYNHAVITLLEKRKLIDACLARLPSDDKRHDSFNDSWLQERALLNKQLDLNQ